jgi:membrane fusion protein (multidrug efflux system)
MKKAVIVIVVIIVIALLAIPKLGLKGDGKEKKGAAKGPGGPVTVSVHVAAPTEISDRMIIGGSVKANEEIDLIAEVAGKITRIYFEEGQLVKKGQLLVKINDDELRAALSKLQVTMKLAKDKEYRQKVLLEKGGISQQEYETAVTDLGSLEEEIKRVNAQLQKTSITAPFSGRVGLRTVSEGSYVSPNTKISTLVNDDPVKIDFSVPEKYAAAIMQGQEVRFFVQGVDSPYIATVYARDPSIDVSTRTLAVRAVSSNKEGKLLPGSFARVEMDFKPMKGSVTVPSEAIVPVLKGQKVFVIKNGEATEQMVETGIRNEKIVEITSGLKVGDSVAVQGIMNLRPGAKVVIMKERK